MAYGIFLIPLLALAALIFTPPAYASSITQQPQDVKAAVEWLPANLENTPTTFTPLEVTFDSQINSGEILWLDLPRKGNRSIVSNASTGTGPGFVVPWGIALDEANGRIIAVDSGLPGLFAIDLATGNRSVFSQSGVAGSGLAFSVPQYLELDAANDRILVSDFGVGVIAVDLTSGDRTLVSGSGTGSGPALSNNYGLAVDTTNNRILVADNAFPASIIAIDPLTGDRTTFSSSAVGTGEAFTSLRGITVDSKNNRAFVTDVNDDAIFSVDLTSGDRTTFSDAATTAVGSGPAFDHPGVIELDLPNQRLLVSDWGQDHIVSVNLASGDRTILSRSYFEAGPAFSGPWGLALDPANKRMLVVDSPLDALFEVDLRPSVGDRTLVSGDDVGTGGTATTDFGAPKRIALDKENNRVLVTDTTAGGVFAVDLASGNRSSYSANTGEGSGVAFSNPRGIVLDPVRDRVLVTDRGLDGIVAIDNATRIRTILSDSTSGTGINFLTPSQLVYDITNDVLYVTDQGTGAGTRTVIAVDPDTGDRNELSGPGAGTGAAFGNVGAIALDAVNSRLLVGDGGAQQVIAVDLATGNRTPFGPVGGDPWGVEVDVTGNRLLVANPVLDEVYGLDLATGSKTVIANTASKGDGPDLTFPVELVVDPAKGRALVLDTDLNALVGLDLFDPVLGQTLGATPFSSSPAMSYSGADGGPGGSFAAWEINGTVSPSVTVTFDDLPIDLTGLPLGEVVNFTVTLRTGTSPLQGTPLISTPAFTMVNAVTADVTPVVDTLDVSQGGGLFFIDGIGDDIGSDITLQVSNNANPNVLGESDFVMTLRGNFTGIASVSASGAPGVYRGSAEDGSPAGGVVDQFLINPGQTAASAVIVGGLAEETSASLDLHLVLDGTTVQAKRSFALEVDVLNTTSLRLPLDNVAGPVTVATLTYPDTDGDGLTDEVETALGTDINNTDTDDDGISDFDEVNVDGNPDNYTPGTDYDPNNNDTDGDTVFDGAELAFGTDPLNSGDFPSSPIRLSTDSIGAEANGVSYPPAFSADGQIAVFKSEATNLVSNGIDSNGAADIFLRDIQTGSIIRISNDSNGDAGNGASENPTISDDGLFVAFDSAADDLVTGDNNGVKDIFIYDVINGTLSRVSTDSGSMVAGNGDSEKPLISADGQYVLFESTANNLVTGDTNTARDVFLKDLTGADTTTRISTGTGGVQSTIGANSYLSSTAGPAAGVRAISADGNYVVFHSEADNLVPGDSGGGIDVFVKNISTDETIIASTNSAGNILGGTSGSVNGEISADGRYVVFRSTQSSLVADDTNGSTPDIFIKDLANGLTKRASTDSNGVEGSGASISPRISADGRYVVFHTSSPLDPGDTNFIIDVYVKDTLSGKTYLVSVDSNGNEGNNDSVEPSISPDGRYVGFRSQATDLLGAGNDNNGNWDTFRAEIPLDTDGDGLLDEDETNTFLTDPNLADTDGDGLDDRQEVGFDGDESTYDPYNPSTNPTGTDTDANVADTDSDGVLDGAELSFGGDPIDPGVAPTSPIRVSTASGGVESNFDKERTAISGDGGFVAFRSNASDLVPGDNNGTFDIFVKNIGTGLTEQVSTDDDGIQGNGGSFELAISRDGRYVAFNSLATNLVPGDANGLFDVFVKDRQTGLTSLVSVADGGGPSDGVSSMPAVSGNGRYIAFVSTAANLVQNDTNTATDVFVRDTQLGITTRVSTDSAGNEVTGDQSEDDRVAITPDGRYVAFVSGANNLVVNDTNGVRDVFVKDTQTNNTIRVSTDSTGNESNADCQNPAISDDGRYVVFSSIATNLVSGDSNGRRDVFLKDTLTGLTTRVSTLSNGNGSNGTAGGAVISSDGRFVAFSTNASDLSESDPFFGSFDVYMKDTLTGSVTLMSVDSGGIKGTGNSGAASVSIDAGFIAFESDANDLVANDTGFGDIFRNVYNSPPYLDPDADDSSGEAGDGYGTVFYWDSGGTVPVPVVDGDVQILDPHSGQMSQVVASLVNPLAGEELSINGALPSGITLDAASDTTNLILTGNADTADYQVALSQVEFDITGSLSDYMPREILLTVTDDTGITGNIATTTVDILVNGVDLVVDTTLLPELVVTGNIVADISVTNYGTNAAGNIVLSLLLPTNASFVSASGTGWDCVDVNGTVLCSRAMLTPDTSTIVTLTLASTDISGPIEFQAAVTSTDADANTGNEAGTGQTTVVDFAGTGFVPDSLAGLDGLDLGASPLTPVTGTGASVAIDGNLLAIGQPAYSVDAFSNEHYGTVVVLKRGVSEWSNTFTPSYIEAPLTAGPGSGRQFGWSVVLQGDMLIVGDPDPGWAGRVYVYQRTGDAWALQQTLIPSSGALTDKFGYALALDGNLLAVGAPDGAGGGSFDGRVYLYERDPVTGVWVERRSYGSVATPSGLALSFPRFGESVALKDSVLIVGATQGFSGGDRGQAFWCKLQGTTCNGFTELVNPVSELLDEYGRTISFDGKTAVIGSGFNPNVPGDAGSALVYQFDGSNMQYVQTLVDSGALGGEQFGSSVAVRDDVIVVGAPQARTPEAGAAQSGSAFIYHRNGGAWIQVQKRSALDAADGDMYGAAVTLNDKYIAVGAPADDVGTDTDYGSVHIFTIQEELKLNSPRGANAESFGMALGTSGPTVAVGSTFTGLPCTDPFGCGVVHLFERNGPVWNLDTEITFADAGGTEASEFGSALSIDGDTLLIGAPNDDTAAAAGSGAAYVFVRSSGAWSTTPQQKLESSAPAANDRFGASVSIDGDNAVIGAPDEVDGLDNPQAGAAYIFARSGTLWAPPQRIVGTDTDGGDQFGTSVSISGDTVVIGAPQAVANLTTGDVDRGIAYTFEDINQDGTWVFDAKLGDVNISDANDSLETGGPAQPANARFGVAVAYDSGTQRVLVGLPQGWMSSQTTTSGVSFGDAYSIIRTLGLDPYLNGWETHFEVPSGNLSGTTGMMYGSAVALRDEIAMIGAPSDKHAGTESGAVFIQQGRIVDAGGIGLEFWSEANKLVANDAQFGDRYGASIDIGLDARVVGAPGSFNFEGAVYIYPTYTTDVTLRGGYYNSAQSVGFVCDACTTVFYTTDGSDPAQAGGIPQGTTIAWDPTIDGPVSITSTTTLKYFSIDSAFNESTLVSETYIIDTAPPTVSVDFPANGEIVGELDPALILIGGTATDTGGGDLLAVQVQIVDDETGNYIDLDASGAFLGLVTTPRWLTATGPLDNWTLPLSTVVPFVSEKSYTINVRAIDNGLLVGPTVTSGFTYYTGTPAFMTLDLTLSSTSILNVPGDDPNGEGEISAGVKLTDPSDLNADLDGSVVTLVITDPNSVVTNIPLTTNINGQETVQDLGDATQIDFDIEGTWTLQAQYAGTLTRDPTSSVPRTLLVGQSAGSAVIVVGREGGTNEGLASHNKTGKRIYDILIERGFQADDIEFYSPDTNRDGIIDGLDGADCEDADGCNDSPTHPVSPNAPNGIDGIPTLAATPPAGQRNVQAAIEGMAALSNANPAPRYVFFIDHGTPGNFLLNLTETIAPADLDTWLDNQEGLLTGGALTKPNVVVLGMCYAGGFLDAVAVDDISNPSPVERVVAASATASEESYKGTEESDGVRVGEFFLEEFVKEANRGATLKAAFEFATGQTEIFTRKGDLTGPDPVFGDVAAQHPLLEDNRSFDPLNLAQNNALPDSPGGDGELADTLFLGVGPTYATNAVGSPADITDVTGTIFLSDAEDTALLTLTANDDTKVGAAWIEVRAPLTDYVPAGGSIQLDPILTREILNPPIPTVLDNWYNTYNQFTTAGKYEIFYVVQDTATGVISPIRRSVVYKNTAGNTVPTAPALLLPADTTTVDTQLLFDWNPATDANGDPITYTLEISTDNTFATVDYRREELLKTHTYVGAEGGLADNTLYYWRVIAVDAFGGQGISGSFSFTTDQTNVVRGVILATVSNALPNVTLQGATVTATLTGSSTVVDPLPGESKFLPSDDDTVIGGTFYRKYPIVGAGVYDITISDVSNFDPAMDTKDISVTGKQYTTTLTVPDADGDGVLDADEIANGTDPNDVDTDDDGIVDGNGGIVSIADYSLNGGAGTPVDTDGDGFVDGEADFGNDPTVADYADGNIAPWGAPDTVVNVADYLIAVRIVTGQLVPTPAEMQQALGHIDMNADGQLNAGDLVLLMNQIM